MPRHRKQPTKITSVIERLLKVRPRSVGELRDRLTRKGFDANLVGQTLETLQKSGILNDHAFALWWVAQRIRLRPRGAYRLLMELREKKIDRETAQKALLESGVREIEKELAYEAIRSRLPRLARLDPVTRRRRLIGFLGRRGFSAETISAIMDSLK
jgi:regulatory protein